MYLPKPKEREGKIQFTTKQKRDQLQRKFLEQHGRCYYCGGWMTRIAGDMRCATRDHLLPQPAGCTKDDSDSNVVVACWRCNYVKGSKRS